MTTNHKANSWIDGTLYSKNRRDFPLQELQKHAGKWVAFSADGTRILASHVDMLKLCEIIDHAGLKPHEVVYSQVHADEVGLE